MFGIFIVMGIVTIVASKLSGIDVLDIVLFSMIISPLALLQKSLREEKNSFAYSGSIFFRQYNWIFQLFSFIFIILFFAILYYYGRDNGFGMAAILFFIATIVQSAYYAFIKLTIPGELFLVPLEIIGLILFNTFVL